jgi:hypothetical protein
MTKARDAQDLIMGDECLPYLADPLQRFEKPAFRAKRLINFPTGKDIINKCQEGWLARAAHAIPPDRAFTIYIFGYASKLGFRGRTQEQSDEANVALSFRRANRAAQIMELINPRIRDHVDRFTAEAQDQFIAEGNKDKDYVAGPNDDSGLWRAIEVHLFLDDPPPPPPQVVPEPPCHGGQRYRKWSIATPLGFSGSPIPGGVIAGNLVVFRRDEGAPAIHYYAAPALGVGFSFSGPKLGQVWEWIKALGPSAMDPNSWSSFTAETPFNFGDLDGATCSIGSLGGGELVGFTYQAVMVSGSVWFRESSGKCMFANKTFFQNVKTSGESIQFPSITGTGVGGALIRIK